MPTVLAALIDVAGNVGVPLLFVVIAIETMGVPVPGESALIAMGIVASQGDVAIEEVIIAAAAAAILGDNIGFLIGRKYGRQLLVSDRGPFVARRRQLVALAEPFFERHGPKAVFLGRWVSGLRICSAWMAGASGMRWPVFTFYNAAGGIAWATSIGLLAYYAGHSADTIIKTAGIGGAVLVVIGGGLAWAYFHRRKSSDGDPLPDEDLA
jgi:membrane protein DedA with SNARE-associated domain